MGFIVNPVDDQWSNNFVLNGVSRHYSTAPVEGTLSVKSVLRGKGKWRTNTAEFSVDDGSYLILNHGQNYSVEITSKQSTETFCVFLRPGFLESIVAAKETSPDDSLEPLQPTNRGFYERLSPHGDCVTAALERIRHRIAEGAAEKWEAEECYMKLAEALLQVQTDSGRQSEALDVARKATRDEIFNRLNIARDYMLSHLHDKLDLDSVAFAASLSPFHFHRLFKQAFGVTPHRFVTTHRIERAKRLLLRTELTINEICWSVGFESVASFCVLFKKATAQSPTTFRNHVTV